MATAYAPILLACEKRWDIKLISLEIENEYDIYQNTFLYRGDTLLGLKRENEKTSENSFAQKEGWCLVFNVCVNARLHTPPFSGGGGGRKREKTHWDYKSTLYTVILPLKKPRS